jgi:hypothetical protein
VVFVSNVARSGILLNVVAPFMWVARQKNSDLRYESNAVTFVLLPAPTGSFKEMFIF